MATNNGAFSIKRVTDGVVSGATLNSGILSLNRTRNLGSISVDLSSLSGGTSVSVVDVEVSSNYELTTTNQNSLLIVDTLTNPISITLPLDPINKQKVNIKDTGNSIVNPISIIGNGKMIDDETDVIIDTNYGSLTLQFFTSFNRWLIISFFS